MREILSQLIPRSIKNMFDGNVYAVGGCVRDTLMGREINDVDLCTSMKPDDVIALCEKNNIKAYPTGIKYGTVTIILESGSYEVTTFRTEVQTGRHPVVQFSDDLEADLSRRDFTMNAIASDVDGNLYDPFDGAFDIQIKTICCVGDPRERFSEDLLRIIRGVRFASTLGFHFHIDTAMTIAAMCKETDICKEIAVERIVAEFQKTFTDSETPSRYLQILWNIGVFQSLIPEMANADDLIQNPQHHPEGSVWKHTLEAVDRCEPKYRWNALFHDIGKCKTAELNKHGYYDFNSHDEIGAGMIWPIGNRLHLPLALEASIERTTLLHMRPLSISQGSNITGRAIRRLRHDAGERHIEALEAVVRADGGDRYNKEWDAIWDYVPKKEEATPALMGRHLIEKGYEEGPEIGRILRIAHNYQIDTGETDIEKLYNYAIGEKI